MDKKLNKKTNQQAKKEKKEKLKKLIEKITPQNRHKEIEWGVVVGKEIW